MVQLTDFFESLGKRTIKKTDLSSLDETEQNKLAFLKGELGKRDSEKVGGMESLAVTNELIDWSLMNDEKTQELFLGGHADWTKTMGEINKDLHSSQKLSRSDFLTYYKDNPEFRDKWDVYHQEKSHADAKADENSFRSTIFDKLVDWGVEPSEAKFYSAAADFAPGWGDLSAFEDAGIAYQEGHKTVAALTAVLATIGLVPLAGDVIRKFGTPIVQSLKNLDVVPEVATAGGPRLSAVDNQTEELLSNRSEMLIGPSGSGVDSQVPFRPIGSKHWSSGTNKTVSSSLIKGFKELALTPTALVQGFKDWATTVPNPKLVEKWQPRWEASVNEWTPFINDLAKKDGFDATGKTLLDIKNLSPENQQLAINKLDEIWQKYGVTFGANGKFIREIDDSKASWDLSKLGYRLDNSGNLKVKEGLEFEPLGKSISLGELMKHDELYEAYPWLKDVEVQFKDDRWHMRGGKPPLNYLGTASDSSYVIQLSSKALKNINSSKSFKTPSTTLLHEIQHLIQFAEKSVFGSVELAQKKIMKSYLKKAILHNKRANILKNKISKLSPGNERDLLEEKLISEQLAAITSSFKGRGNYVYRNLWSEIEANNAADRIWYKAKVKKDKSPWSTLKQSYALHGSRAELLQLAFTKADGTFDAKGYVKHMNKLEDMMINSGMVKDDIASQLYEVNVAQSFKATKSPDDISIEYDDLIYDALEKKFIDEGILLKSKSFIKNRLEMDGILHNVFKPKSPKQVNPEQPTFGYDISKVETGDKSKYSGLMSRSISASKETPTPSTNTGGAGEIGTNPYNVDVDRLKNYNSQQLRETDELVTEGGNSTAGSKEQTAKINAPIEEGAVISARLNLNSKIDSSLPATPDNRLQTVHPVNKSGNPDYKASESYKTFVTVENGRFDVDQKGRLQIAESGLKTPAASITGTYTTSRNVLDEMDDTVVEIGINPAVTHLFVDMKTGQAVKDFEIATAFRDRVYAKGVTYWKKTDAPEALGNVTNETRYAFNKGGLMSRSI